MTMALVVSPVEVELAKLMKEYGPKWGHDVPAVVDSIANAKPGQGTRAADEQGLQDETGLQRRPETLEVDSPSRLQSTPTARTREDLTPSDSGLVERVRLDFERVTEKQEVTEAVRDHAAYEPVAPATRPRGSRKVEQDKEPRRSGTEPFDL